MFAWIITLGQWIWNGIQAATTATVAFLASTVEILWSVVRATGSLLWKVGTHVWDFFRATWDHVLKPAWDKVFKFVDRVHDWSEKWLAPALRKLNALRKALNGWWKRYVRPVLDLIDITRRALRIAVTLHIPFAHTLDVELGKIEDTIERSFRFVLAQLNEVINIVNRVVTFDGLFQRAALVKSLARDYQYAWRAIANPYRKAITDDQRTEIPHLEVTNQLPAVLPGIHIDLGPGGPPGDEFLRELAAQWRGYLSS